MMKPTPGINVLFGKINTIDLSFSSLLILFLLLGLASGVGAQQYSTGARPFTGKIRLNTSFYHSFDDSLQRRSPYTVLLSGNTTYAKGDFQMPIYFSVRRQKDELSSAFNRFRISPTYKQFKLHLGTNSLTWSPYTLDAHTFLGAALEATPGKFRLSALYGEFENVIAQRDSAVFGAERLLDENKRYGLGGKIGYGSDESHVDLILLKIWDTYDTSLVETEIKGIGTINSITRPQENFLAGLNIRWSPLKALVFESHLAGSAITLNRGSLVVDSSSSGLVKTLYNVAESINMTVNGSTRGSFAGDASLNLKFKKARFNIKYQRVEPLYTSLGTYYVRNDFENRTGGVFFRLFNNKMVFRGNMGLQRNNLNNLRRFTHNRTIGSAYLTFRPSRKWMFQFNYSNYNLDMEPQSEIISGTNERMDSLRYRQLSERFLAGGRYWIEKNKVRHVFRLQASRQSFEMERSLVDSLPRNFNYNAFLAYELRLLEKQLSVYGSVNYNYREFREIGSRRYGGTVGGRLSLFDRKMKIRLSSTYNKSTRDGMDNGHIVRARANLSYKVKKKYSLALNINYLAKELNEREMANRFSGYSELIIQVYQTFSF